jgi:thiol-disulfide isomerase/thioredoxin
MKKSIFITAGVIALLAIMVWADRKFPPAGTPAAGVGVSNTPTDAPTIALKDLNDQDVTLAQYKGKVVLLNFWATWCEPCKAEIPWLIEFQQKYGPRGFTILGVAMDEEGKRVVNPYLEKERFDVNGQKEAMNYPILLGSDSIAEKFGGVMGLPTSMLFTRDGKKVRTVVGLALPHDDYAKIIEGML